MDQATPSPFLEVRDLVKHFSARSPGLFGRRKPPIRALNGVSFCLDRGDTLAIVGESGCGKSTLAKTLALLYRPDSGKILFEGKSVEPVTGSESGDFRRRSQLIFQDPYGSLNPRLTVAEIIAEPLVIQGVNRHIRSERVTAVASSVALAEEDLRKYPHQFSGGQRQRIAIARAIISEPQLVIADEPLSALDISVQSQVINLLVELKRSRGLTYILICHDLAVVAYIADRVAVMYLGRIVEIGPAESVFSSPMHPYTRALMVAAPKIGKPMNKNLFSVTGEVANPGNAPNGCPFHPRCPNVQEICAVERPRLEENSKVMGNTYNHAVACHFSEAI
ncbi:MAG: oligopeptide/dipeptide ABC transporter ATP-binding protein [Pseudomonadota bacterium]|nr:oligopeptide/dipeptide ABC transporter ATP-binding protein [Pseudomonadota bacterium]